MLELQSSWKRTMPIFEGEYILPSILYGLRLLTNLGLIYRGAHQE